MATAPERGAADRPRQVIGRAAEVSALDSALMRLQAGRGRAIAVAGEPGIGKSMLVTHLAARARAVGIQVVGPAFGDVIAAVGACGASGPGGASGAGGPSGPGGPGRASGPSGAGGTPGESGTPSGSPIVAVADELHRIASDDLPALERLIRAATDAPMLLLLAYRRRQLAPAVAAAISRAVAADLLDVWELGPLSRDEARALVGDLPNLAAVHEASGGNPQYLRILSADGDPHADAARAVVGELAELDHTALTTLQTLAVLGEPAHPQLIAAVAGLSATEALDALDSLTRLDIVRPTGTIARFAIRHPAVSEVVYRRIDPGSRITIHLRAESVLAGQAAPIARRAYHLTRAADPSRPEHTATLLAAARLTIHTAPADAARYLQAALPQLQENSPEQREAQVLLARAQLLTGQASQGRSLLHTLPAIVGNPTGDVTAVAVAGRLERQLGQLSESAAILRSGLASVPDDDSAAAALHSMQADNALDQADYVRARHHAEAAATLAHGVHDIVGEALARAQAALALLSSDELDAAEVAITQAAELVDAASDAALLRNLEAVYQLGFSETMLSRLADGERHLIRGAALSRSSGQTYILPMILKTLADTQARAGSVKRALATLDEADLYVENAENPATKAILAIIRASALVWTNEDDAQRQALAWADRAAAWTETRTTVWAVVVRCRRAEIVLFSGDAPRAGRLLLEAAGGPDLPNLIAARRTRSCDTLSEIALREKDPLAADRWAALAEASLEQLPSASTRAFASRARMRAQWLRDDLKAALASAQQAIDGFAASGERIEVCRTLSEAATLAAALGHHRQARDWLDRATTLAEQCEATLLVDETTKQRTRLAEKAAERSVQREATDALAALTTREREIAALASTGVTSVQIAERLFLSRRTVDAHLGQIYRKLGVSSRAALIRTVLDAEARG
ncbi:DNA-binding CsgD family transcriptional regulator [Catenulispora sp. EB89]|uniref:LuxR C-terminal-related transcriptional regulator n=1 Tax=Catenulispora sp. EB89 TaxID=3156257 RepID=UPI003517B42D